jgi:predicted SAM-dependent methyltransferase
MVNKLKRTLKALLGIIPWQENTALHRKNITKYLQQHDIRKIQFGCGPNFLQGWLNTDIYKGSDEVVYLDITREFAIPSNSFHYMTSEHLIEHISFNQGKSFLKECLRVLKTRGVIRIVTPNLQTILNLYANKTADNDMYIHHIISNFIPNAPYNPEVFVINNAFRNWGHQFLYDKPTLINLLNDVGFKDIHEVKPGVSSHEHLNNIDARHQSAISNINEFEVMVFEASKP